MLIAHHFTMYDSTVPSAIPASVRNVAAYRTGAYAEHASDFHGKRIVWWIDVTGTDPEHASVLDIEPGAAVPAQVRGWVRLELRDHDRAWLYESVSNLPSVKAEVAALPRWERNRVDYWTAEYTAHEHVTPGATATQYFGGDGINGPQMYDKSEVSK